MSASSDEEISNRNGYQRGGSDGDDEQDEEDATRKKKKKKKKNRTKFDFGKRLLLNQFSKAKNQIRKVRSKKHLLSSSSSSTTATPSFSRNVNVSCRGKVVIIQGEGNNSTTARNGFGCKFCFSRPNVLENPNGSPSSDPNDPKFTHSMLKSLLEKNDFCSKECNPHIESLVE